MNLEKLSKIIKAAKGEEKADLVIKNCQIVNPITKNIKKADIAIQDGIIAGCGTYFGKSEINANGLFATSGLIDAHVHIESSMCSPEAFAQMIIPLGTTAVIADPHEIANVKGIDGIHFMMNSARKTPLKVKFMIPSCVPATDFEDSGAIINTEDVEQLLQEPSINGLGEMMNATGVCNADSSVLQKIIETLQKNKNIDGHAPNLSGNELNAYCAAGITTDHECVNADEVKERIENGMYVLFRQGSAAQNLKDLLPALSESNSRHCLMCSDDKHPQDILTFGHMNHNLKIAVSNGIDFFTAIAMATINTAECYNLKNTGLIAPGYNADIVLWNNLKDFKAEKVFINGILQAQNEKPLFKISNRIDKGMTHTVNIKPFTTKDLKINLKSENAKIISLIPHSIVTKCVIRKIQLDNGFFDFQKNKDIQKLVVMERHNASGKIGLALIENYGISGGAIATTIAHDSHNIIAVGDSDEDIKKAIDELNEIGGGIVLVSKNELLGKLSLPIAGLMSETTGKETASTLNKLLEIAYTKLSISRTIEPFMTLSFLALPVIPELKLTARGLFDVNNFCFTKLESD